ncbi:DinB family protein [Rhodococcus sp. Z13]|uniref:DinB family protein n=1 Tax=Rhodococcus sacchari TaxID=2962047 RepID=A0ACD4DF85_9NOCA|nr:DinB family protein [Rhodococcus sp. Z13]UYP18750.1 DinB family protein [Rhodococcus sp. Z13]
MTSTVPTPATRVLLTQLDLVWLFADQHVLPRIDDDALHWAPSSNCVDVRSVEGRLVADLPDEDTAPLPETTIAWLLWHIEWWWSNTIAVCRGGAPTGPDAYEWSGSTKHIGELRTEWSALLSSTDVETTISGLMPHDTPLWEVAGWVNFELTKNISEIGQLLTRRANIRN